MKKEEPFNLILLGDPAAGKATQAKWIAKKYKMRDFDMGREVRRPSVSKKYDFARSTAQGKLTPTGIVRDIFRETIARTPESKGILFDGTPKMAGEARLVASLLRKMERRDPLVIYLSVPIAESFRRMIARGRKDDTPAALRNRIAYYHRDVARSVAFLKTKYPFKRISGVGAPREVAKRIEKEIISQKRQLTK